MKIGLACTGNGPGARYAHVLAEELDALSLCPEMISCASLTAAPMLLWSRGLPDGEIEKRVAALLSARDTGRVLARFCARLPRTRQCSLALCSVDLETGVTMVWADGLRSEAWNLKARSLEGMEKAALRSVISPQGMTPQKWGALRLCDFSTRYGCPLFPLKLAGMERVLSVVFAGGDSPAAVAAESLSTLTGKNADLHYTLHFSRDDGPDAMREFLRIRRSELYEKLLF